MRNAPVSLIGLVLTLPLVLVAQPAVLSETFETAVDPVLPEGWSADKSGNLPGVQVTLIGEAGLIIGGKQSLLFVVSGETHHYDHEIGGFYSAHDARVRKNLEPGNYRVSVRFRVVDPGIKANVNFFYTSHDRDWVKQTNNISLASQAIESGHGMQSWVSEPFTVRPDNERFYTGMQIQVLVNDAPVERVRIVVDDFEVIAIPAP